MKFNISVRRCEMCHDEAQEHEKSFGGSVFNGWFEIRSENFGTSLAALSKETGPWDFCSKKCAIEYLEKLP